MELPDAEEADRDAIRHWWRLTDLADFAEAGHGCGDSNGGFGVIYPGDLDEYDGVAKGINILEGFVSVYGFWGPPEGYEVLVPESLYLDQLAIALSAAGHMAESKRMRLLAEQRRSASGGQ